MESRRPEALESNLSPNVRGVRLAFSREAVCKLLILRPRMRIPVKWATHSGGMWAGVRRASRRGKDMMTEVAHTGQEESGKGLIVSSPSFRFHHLVCRLDSGDVGHRSGDVGHPGTVACGQ